jgi:hypothetical protein
MHTSHSVQTSQNLRGAKSPLPFFFFFFFGCPVSISVAVMKNSFKSNWRRKRFSQLSVPGYSLSWKTSKEEELGAADHTWPQSGAGAGALRMKA